MQTKEQAFEKLSRSKFRSSFYLNNSDLEYIKKQGMDVIRRHTADFVKMKIAAAYPVNDGKQTPMRGHPVFKAMHATAFCCRGCMNKWYRVPFGRELTAEEQERIVNFLMAWVERELTRNTL